MIEGTFITYWNSESGSICGNDVQAMYEVLQLIQPADRITFFVKSDGGDGTSSLRIIHLLREYAKRLIVVAPLPDVGYTFRLRRSDVTDALVAFAAFAAIAIPLGLGIGFLRWAPRSPEPLVWFQGAIGIYFLTAIPEELLFRGGFQNLLEKRWPGGRARMWSLVIGSIVFGAAHLDNPPAPNFRYMLLATLAGVAYGWVWQRTARVPASRARRR